MEEKTRESNRNVDESVILQWISSTMEGQRLQPDEAEQFKVIAMSNNLNPFKREIHTRITQEEGKRKVTFITGFEVYLRRAAESSLLDGFTSHVEQITDDLKATVRIYRKDWKHPFIHEAFFNEVAQRDANGNLFSFWKRSGRYMLRKVALSQGFRLAFPELLAGLPYEGSEMPPEIMQQSEQPSNPSTEHKNYVPQTKTSPASSLQLVEEIKDLTLKNQSLLKPAHVSWIMEQLLIEKSVKQLEGLKAHVIKALQEAQNQSIPDRQKGNRIKSFPAGSRNTGRPSPQHYPQAAGAEVDIF
jgi:hypothetical protein